MKTLDEYLNEQLQNEEFSKEWEDIQPEMNIIRAITDARTSQNITQKELAARTGIISGSFLFCLLYCHTCRPVNTFFYHSSPG